MYSDLFDQLNARNSDTSRTSAANGPEPLVSFKAGKINLTWNNNTDHNSFLCEADHRRGEIRLIEQSDGLQWQWYDRREKKVVETLHITEPLLFERIPLEQRRSEDRIYVLSNMDHSNEYRMYWMQDKVADNDDDIVAQVNEHLQSAKQPSSVVVDNSAVEQQQQQVDALSNILENLGMPQQEAASTTTTANDAASNRLTLADLQGAMAGVQQQQQQHLQQQRPGPALTEVVTPGAITTLLEDEQVRQRLLELLPEQQRSEHYLEENLRSPQVQQTLRSLTLALVGDDTGSLDNFYSVLANFQLDPADGQEALVANNPIQAFLDAILRKVEKEEQNEE